MHDLSSIALTTHSSFETEQLAGGLADIAAPGRVLLLNGQIGAGKTLFARAFIQACLDGIGMREEVPSPTFTLVQTYDVEFFEIWHADLYRLTQSASVLELGLVEAFETAFCLVEWPDRLGDLTPADAIKLDIAVGPTEFDRRLAFHGTPELIDLAKEALADA